MSPRQSLIDLFSTFLRFEDDRSSGWLTDPRLRRSMLRAQDRSGEQSADFWTQYWHQQCCVQSDRVAAAHLSAYLQESCYWAASKTLPRGNGGQFLISDCFQIAIAEVPRILKKWDTDHSLKAYATVAFSNFIRERLRKQQEINLCSDWGLLLRLSRKQLRESLENAGMSVETIASYLLAFSVFETSYAIPTPGTRKIVAPDRATWEAITQHYNRERQRQSPQAPEGSVQTLEAWLRQCITAARQYLYPALTSLNAPKPGQDSGEWQDDLPDAGGESLLTELIAAEDVAARQVQRAQMQAVLTTAIAQLKPEAHQILHLYYQQGLTQQQIAEQLHLPQYTVSRKLARARESLLVALISWRETLTHWPETGLHNSSNVTMMKSIGTLLEAWLQSYYQVANLDPENVL